jgi:hypothetical protein
MSYVVQALPVQTPLEQVAEGFIFSLRLSPEDMMPVDL